MKINSKILSIPPYISTTWSNVRAIYLKNSDLIINLHQGDTVSISGLPSQLIDNIFASHMNYLNEQEHSSTQTIQENPFKNPGNFYLNESGSDATFKIGIGFLEEMGAAMQHNPAQMNTPDLPKQILEKIGTIAKIIPIEDIQNLPKPEPHCNCPHCQIARALTQHFDHHSEQTLSNATAQIEEEVSEEDLQFQQWEIAQTGDKLYNVINRLDTKEKYSVYLGHPVGCTCGKTGCEHILAVLKS